MALIACITLLTRLYYINDLLTSDEKEFSESVINTINDRLFALKNELVLSESELWVGHILANYALPFENAEEDEEPKGAWKHSIRTSVESTMSAFPGARLFAHLDRKSFKGWQRTAILGLLEELRVPVSRGKELNESSQL